MTTAGAIAGTTLLAATDAGMHALWKPARFTGITDYETWENALLEDDDIIQRVRAGELVPVNIRSDGAFQFLVRVGTASQAPALTSREAAPQEHRRHARPARTRWASLTATGSGW
jgi:hypothetical protein